MHHWPNCDSLKLYTAMVHYLEIVYFQGSKASVVWYRSVVEASTVQIPSLYFCAALFILSISLLSFYLINPENYSLKSC